MKIIEKQFLATAIMTVVGIAVLMSGVLDQYLSKSGHIPLVPLLFLTGCLGGLTNHYRRLQALPVSDAALTAITSHWSIVIQSIASPGLGGVFAVIAYLGFGSGLWEGALIPKFEGADLPYNSADALKGLFHMIPCQNKDVAMMFIWAFFAGFSERFVPNLLDRLARESDEPPRPPNPPLVGTLPPLPPEG